MEKSDENDNCISYSKCASPFYLDSISYTSLDLLNSVAGGKLILTRLENRRVHNKNVDKMFIR